MPATEITALCHHLSASLRGCRFIQAKTHSIESHGLFGSSVANPFAKSSMEELQSLGVVDDAVVQTTEQIFSPIVNSCFLGPMRNIGVHSLSTAADFCPVDEKVGDRRLIDFNHKGCFFFVSLMMKNKTISLINKNNEPEFQAVNGTKVCNRKFWSANLEIKRLNHGHGFFKTLELAAFIPDWTVVDVFKHKHQDAMEWMARNAAVLTDKTTFFLSLKQDYATVFLRNMESELVAKARLAGFQPPFLMKNAIIQKTEKFGVNGTQVTTINIQPKSYLALIRFFKGNGDNLQVITLKNEAENFMVLDNHHNH